MFIPANLRLKCYNIALGCYIISLFVFDTGVCVVLSVVIVVVGPCLNTVFVSRLFIWPCFSRFLFERVQRVYIPCELSASTRALVVGSAVLLRCIVRLVPGLSLLLSVHLMHLTPLLVSLRVSPVVIVLLSIAIPLIAVLLVPCLLYTSPSPRD